MREFICPFTVCGRIKFATVFITNMSRLPAFHCCCRGNVFIYGEGFFFPPSLCLFKSRHFCTATREIRDYPKGFIRNLDVGCAVIQSSLTSTLELLGSTEAKESGASLRVLNRVQDCPTFPSTHPWSAVVLVDPTAQGGGGKTATLRPNMLSE